MAKGAMRRLKLHDWSTAMILSRKFDEAGIDIHQKNPKEKLDKERRSERLAAGLVWLARECHVSQVA
jgi:hypothetical protein